MSQRRRGDRETVRRDVAGEARDQAGDVRDVVGVARDQAGALRDKASDRRDHAGELRDEGGDGRDQAGDRRDRAADERDQANTRRDDAAERRDRAGDRRDDEAEQRDSAADLRDRVAQARDLAADRREGLASEETAGARSAGAALARRQAAMDRSQAAEDRQAGADARTQGEADRGTALADRNAGADERAKADTDRYTSLADRRAGAGERAQARTDRRIALTDRRAGAGERAQADTDRGSALEDRRAGADERAQAVTDRVSERVAAQQALDAARDYMLAVTDSMGDGLFTLDSEGGLTYMNGAAESLLGWSSDELRSLVMHDVVHRGSCEASSSAIGGCRLIGVCRHRQTVQVDDDVFRHRNGRDVHVAYTASPFATAEGIEGTVVVFKDVSERRAREQSLRRDAEQFAWIGRIQAALAEDRFVLHAQPIVDLGSGETVQRELLLRMREPDGDLVGPSAFLAVAEQTGLIREIDRWVIRRATEIAATGHTVEINVSGHSLSDDSMLEHLEACLQGSGANPALIAFEITETAFVDDMAAARVFAARLRGLGCRLALDDFGTGYSGFTYLKQIPVDVLKIDMEFVRDVTTNSASRHVVEAVVALARNFGLQTIAEGIEDSETFALLRDLQVDYGQGFHIARPQPFDETAGISARR